MREAQQRPKRASPAVLNRAPATASARRARALAAGAIEHDLERISVSTGAESRRRIEVLQLPLRAVVARAGADRGSRDETAAGATRPAEPDLEVPALEEAAPEEEGLASPEGDAIAGPADLVSSRDTISATVALVPTVARGGVAPGAGDFGITGSRASLSAINITPGTGNFTVTANLDLAISWEVRSATGPDGQLDIHSETDADITPTNYPTVASDLTPDPTSDRGRPPRTMFWAEDLTIRHEIFHTTQRSGPFGRARVAAIKAFLDGQMATTAADVRALLPMALAEGQRVFNAMISAPAGEGDAYADGAPLYQARADAIQRRGDLGLYNLGDFPLPDPDGPRFA